MEKGADVNIYAGYSFKTRPADLARAMGHKDIIKLLEPKSNDMISILKRCFAAIKQFFCGSKLPKESSVAPVTLQENHASEVSINPDILKQTQVSVSKGRQ